MKKIKKFIFLLTVFLWLTFPVSGQQNRDTAGPALTEKVIPGEKYPIENAYAESISPDSNGKIEPLYYQIEIDPSFKDDYRSSVYDYDRPEKEKKPKERIENEETGKVRKSLFTLSATAMKVTLFTILGLIVLTIVYFVIKNSGGFHFGSGRRQIDVKSGAQKSGEDPENIDNNDFASLIQNAKSRKEFRKAIRYYYLWVLQKLSDKKLIRWDRDKTDYDYYLELSENSIRKDFSENAYIFDHVWYGNFQMSEKEFKLAESLFNRTLDKLK